MSYDPNRITGYAGNQLTGYEVECLLFHMPSVAERATDSWVKNFAKSVLRQARRGGWRPSEKQAALMRRLVSDLFQNQGGDDAVIES